MNPWAMTLSQHCNDYESKWEENTSKPAIKTAICIIGNGIWGFNLCLGWRPAHLAGLWQTHKQDPQRLTDTNWQQRSPNSCAKLGSATSFTYSLPVVTAFSVPSKEEREGILPLADRKRELREELEDLNENKRIERSTWKTKTAAGREDRDEEDRIGGRKEVFFSPVVDMMSVAAIRTRKTHQWFVCSVRVN